MRSPNDAYNSKKKKIKKEDNKGYGYATRSPSNMTILHK